MVKFFNIFLLLGLFCGMEVVCMEGGGAAAEDSAPSLRRSKAVCGSSINESGYDSEPELERQISRTQTMPSPSKTCGAVVEQKPMFCEAILKTPTVKISDKFKEYLGVSTRIRGAFYNFTLYDVAVDIVKQKPEFERNAELIINHRYQDDHCEALKHLVENGINCYSHAPTPSMGSFADLHTKFCLMKNKNGDKVVWQGSWNLSGHADENNTECVTVTNSPRVVRAFKDMFKDLKKSQDTKLITVEDCTCPAKKGKIWAKRLNRIPDEKMER